MKLNLNHFSMYFSNKFQNRHCKAELSSTDIKIHPSKHSHSCYINTCILFKYDFHNGHTSEEDTILQFNLKRCLHRFICAIDTNIKCMPRMM